MRELAAYLCILGLLSSYASASGDHPPRLNFKIAAAAEVAFKLGDPVRLPCEAVSQPPPSYQWTKDGATFHLPSDGSIRQLDAVGTLEISRSSASHAGVYQCTATNRLGTAVGPQTTLKKAIQEHFPTVRQPARHRPVVGTSLTLRCHPPTSYPPAMVYWGWSKPGSTLRPVDGSDRVSLDYDGNLHFANVHLNDSGPEGFSYVCTVQNTVLRNIVQGDDQVLAPYAVTAQPRYAQVRLLWSSPVERVAMRTSEVRMKCIFAGYPTPRVHWRRVDGKAMPANSANDSFGQELIIHNVDYDDAGKYECVAMNTESIPATVKEFTLTVESPPYFEHVNDLDVAEDDDVIVNCSVSGVPSAVVQWLSNGRPIEDLPKSDRLTVNKNWLTLLQVTVNDSQVFQCNATNKHGYALTNVYVNVHRGEEPRFTEDMIPSTTVVEGTNVTLRCHADGKPTPSLAWTRDSDIKLPNDNSSYLVFQVVFIDNRLSNERSNILYVQNVKVTDGGNYTCRVSNKYGSISANSELVVRRKTKIKEPPTNTTAVVNANLTLRCGAEADAAESSRLAITWTRNGRPIETLDAGRRISQQDDGSIKILNATVADSGQYACNASTGVDSVQSFASVTVQDRPESPTGVQVIGYSSQTAEIAWEPAEANNAPVTEYTVRYRSASAEDGELDDDDAIGVLLTTARRATIHVVPWRNYTFNVAASNALGISDASNSVSFQTKMSTPFRHPAGVCTRSTAVSDRLVVVWQPMRRREHNGENFHYVVWFRKHSSNDSGVEVEVKDWKQDQLVIENQPPFTRFDVRVKAVNREGEAPLSELSTVDGRTGEEAPAIVVQNFRVISLSSNGTGAEFGWNAVNESSEEIRGYFKGYRIQFWKAEKPEDVRTEDIILREPKPCPRTGGVSPRKRRANGAVVGRTDKMWPYSRIEAGVMVLNGHFAGKLSAIIQFTTPEGVPGPVTTVAILEQGSHHVKIAWSVPDEPNGVLRNYSIQYAPNDGSDSPAYETLVADASKLEQKILDLKDNTSYSILVSASTVAGQGTPVAINITTVQSTEPDKPLIVNTETGNDFVAVTWNSSDQRPALNPGGTFYVEHRREGSEEWEKTEVEGEKNRINVTDLEQGALIELRVVAVNGIGETTPSDIQTVFVGHNNITSPVNDLRISEAGSHHVKIAWTPPSKKSDNITGYKIECKQVPGERVDDNRIQAIIGSGEEQKIRGLHENTTYRVYVWPLTPSGQGSVKAVDVRTKPASAPDKPVITETTADGNDSVHVAWLPSDSDRISSSNPGDTFFVEYRPIADDEWQRTSSEDNNNYINVTNLPNGAVIELRVVAESGDEETSASDVETILVGHKSGPATNVVVSEKGSHHIKIAWEPPLDDATSPVIGYRILYMSADKSTSRGKDIKEIPLSENGQLEKKLHGLQDNTSYSIYIWPITSNGNGNVKKIHTCTQPLSPPDQPVIVDSMTGHNFVVIGWNATAGSNQSELQNSNPGASFYVDYRTEGSAQWLQTTVEKETNWINVTDLEHGSVVELRVVAVNGIGETAPSEVLTVRIQQSSRESVSLDSASMSRWTFIGAMLAILMLVLLIFIIFWLIRSNQGQNYYVLNTEKQCGHTESTHEDSFGEYEKSNAAAQPTQENLSDREEKTSIGSDVSSIEECPDPGKFNEDGSFIGQYSQPAFSSIV